MNIDLLAPSTRELYRKVTPKIKKATHVIEVTLLPLPFFDISKFTEVVKNLGNYINPVLKRFGFEFISASYSKKGQYYILDIYIAKTGSVIAIIPILLALARVLLPIAVIIVSIVVRDIMTKQIELQETKESYTEKAFDKWYKGELSTKELITILKAAAEEEKIREVQAQSEIRNIFATITGIVSIASFIITMFLVFKIMKMIRGVTS